MKECTYTSTYIFSGIHAREWISPAVVTYIIRELIENHDSHPEYLQQLNFHIMPVTNPDGYEYTRAEDGQRSWRKSRADLGSEFEGCVGVDLNRNWDAYFGGNIELNCQFMLISHLEFASS